MRNVFWPICIIIVVIKCILFIVIRITERKWDPSPILSIVLNITIGAMLKHYGNNNGQFSTDLTFEVC